MNLDTIEEISVDVLVIGAGGAGLRAAYESAVNGAETLLVNKGRIGYSGATAVGLASAAGFSVPDGTADPEDTPDVLYNDIMTAAQGCADPRLVRILADEAVEACAELDRWDIDFIIDKETGKPIVAQGDFASRPRNRKIFHHGKPIALALRRECKKVGVRTIEHAMVLDLLTGDNGIQGALILRRDGVLVAVHCGAVVIGTGGAGQLFRYSLLPSDITGDGYALSYRCGATLANMEFMQAGFGTIKPAKNMIMSWNWAVMPKFTDEQGRDILEGQLPDNVSAEMTMVDKSHHYPFSCSDHSFWLEYAAKRAIEEGRASSIDGFYLDLRVIDKSRLDAKGFDQLFEVSKAWLLRKKMDVTKGPLHIGLFGHAINGGVTINTYGESDVAGLLAAGEAAAGPYGADRLGGNMLLNCQVFGRRSGLRAAETGRLRAGGKASYEQALNKLKSRVQDKEISAINAHKRIKATMSENALVIRNENGLKKAWNELQSIHSEVNSNFYRAVSAKEVWELYATENLADVGLMMLGAARLRKESRGSHFRDDAREKDPQWERPIFVNQGDGEPVYTAATFAERAKL